MKVEIDQSGRVEYTSVDTVIAFSNTKRRAIKIKAKDKRELQAIFRRMGKKRVYVIRLFSVLISLLLRNESKVKEIFIDLEYPGWEAQIKGYLVGDFERLKIKIDPNSIHFKKIGKKSEAHWHAHKIFKNERKAEIIASLKDIFRILFH